MPPPALSASSMGVTSSSPPRALPSVHILVGEISQSDATSNAVLLSNEWGKDEACHHLRRTLLEFGYQHVEIHALTLTNYVEKLSHLILPGNVLFNLCDGTELDHYPGISVTRYLADYGAAYTGADPQFFEITTSKPVLKRSLIANAVSTSPFVEMRGLETLEQDVNICAEQIPFPWIIKPSVSYASISISDKSVVHSKDEAMTQCRATWNAHSSTGGLFIERYFQGREFTALVIGDATQGLRVLTVAERVFDERLGVFERLLAFDRYWAGYSLEGESTDSSHTKVYSYAPAPDSLQPRLKELAKNAYLALDGCGYGRVDIRSDTCDEDSLELFVLEVNANCGLSFDTSSTMGEILRMSQENIHGFAHNLVQYAMKRSNAT